MTAYFDVSGMLPPLSVPRSHRVTPRCGDRALIYAYLSLWREEHSDSSLVLVEDEAVPNRAPFDRMTRWLARALGAEYRLATEERLPGDLGGAVTLNRDSLWSHWARIRHEGSIPKCPSPDPAAVKVSQGILRRHRLRVGEYVTVQPLISVPYNEWRTREVSFWERVIADVSRYYPTVVVGGPECLQLADAPPGVIYAFERGIDLVESLDLVAGARVHLGGETGLTLWAPILGTATVALYNARGYEYLPLPFGQPLSILSLASQEGAPLGTLRDCWERAVSARKML